jgi:glycosyltransferase involved in cell wall biosynthesis
MKNIRVCYLAGREADYSRTRTIIAALGIAGFDVVTCLPKKKGFSHYPKIILDFLRKKRDCDLVIVGFYGQLLLPVAWLFSRKPILFDLYITTFGTMVDDRQIARANSPLGRLFWLLDRISMALANSILIETRDHIKGYAKTFRIPERKFRQVFLALDPKVVRPKSNNRESGKFLVHFHGEYAPFHGVRYILKSAHLLRHEDVEFQIIGKGITWEADMRLARELNLKNCRFIDRVPYEQLADYMSKAQACLGIFGDNPRTMRVLTNKVVEALAVGRPLITARNNSVQELVKDGVSAILIRSGNPDAIATAIRRLMHDAKLRDKIGRAGYEAFIQNCTLSVFSNRLKSIITDMIEDPQPLEEI